jgi:hypothetical protein
MKVQNTETKTKAGPHSTGNGTQQLQHEAKV